jgi:hypothetical protein
MRRMRRGANHFGEHSEVTGRLDQGCVAEYELRSTGRALCGCRHGCGVSVAGVQGLQALAAHCRRERGRSESQEAAEAGARNLSLLLLLALAEE